MIWQELRQLRFIVVLGAILYGFWFLAAQARTDAEIEDAYAPAPALTPPVAEQTASAE